MNTDTAFLKRLGWCVIFFVMVFLLLDFFYLLTSHTVCFQNHCFDVALAKTQAEQEKGLMFQKSLAANKGMLFIFSEQGRHAFWMKHTLIPLDIIWMDNNHTVVFINQNALPCAQGDCPVIKPPQNAMYVLEINGGMAQKIGLQVGDNIEIKI